MIGHSRGGYSVINSLSKNSLVYAGVLLASISGFPLISKEDEEEWRELGVRYVENTRTGEQLPLGIELLDDILRNLNTMEQNAKNVTRPLIIIHGDQDSTVKMHSARNLHSWVNNSELVVIEKANHVFGAKHPFEGTNPDLEKVIEKSLNFLKKNISF